MVRRPPLRDEDRAEWDFSDLLRWHLERGTRPEASPRQPGRPWPIKVFADSLGVNDRTVRNWIWGRFLPSSLAPIERSLFGQNFDYTEWSRELREAFSRGNRDLESEVDEFRRRRLLGSEARLSIEDFQTYIADTPLIAPYALVSYSIFLGGHSNQIRPLDDLLTGGALGDFRAQTAEDFDDLLSHLVGDAPSSLQAELKVSVLRAIDKQWAVLYTGSVNPANSAPLSKP